MLLRPDDCPLTDPVGLWTFEQKAPMDCPPTYGCWPPELSLNHFAGDRKQLKWYLEGKRFASRQIDRQFEFSGLDYGNLTWLPFKIRPSISAAQQPRSP